MELNTMCDDSTTERIFPVRPSIDHDVQAALSLARASTAALLSLSALGRREIIAALTNELALLNTSGDGPSRYAAEVLARYLPGRLEPKDR